MATFYVDLQDGTWNTYTALTSCVASNPSGTITRINKTAHGLATGNIVVLTNFSAWLNGQWTVTFVDANNFDLQGAVWQTTADNNGTVQRVWGRQWSEAMNYPQSRINATAGDIIKYKKSPAPTSIGNATWTNKSITVTLATAQTTLIDDCDSGWTAAAGGDVTVSTNTTRKSGTAKTVLTFDAAIQTNIKQAYKTLGAALNLSAYDSVTFWFQSSSVIADNNRLRICLCSDATGDTVVDEFIIPKMAGLFSAAVYVPLVIKKTGGGNLGNNINSIAVYTRGAAITASANITLDNINACNETGLTLTTLISKSSNTWEEDSNKLWYPIKSINGTTVTIDGARDNTQTAFGNELRGYWTTGTSPETVTTYIQRTTLALLDDRSTSTSFSGASTVFYLQSQNGSIGNPIHHSGGWDSATDTRDGMTWVNMSGFGHMFINDGNCQYYKLSYFGAIRGFVGELTSSAGAGSSFERELDHCAAVGCEYGMFYNISGQANDSGHIKNYIVANCNKFPYRMTPMLYRVGDSGFGTDRRVEFTNFTLVSNESLTWTDYIATNKIENWKIYNAGRQASDNLLYYFKTYAGWEAPFTSDSFWKNFDIKDCVGNIFSINLSATSINNFLIYPNIKDWTVENSGNVYVGTQNATDVSLNQTVYILNSTFTNNTSMFSSVYYPFFAFTDSSVSNTTKSPASNGRPYTASTTYDRYAGSATDYRSYNYLGDILSNTTERHTASGISWQLVMNRGQAPQRAPQRFKVATVAFNANSAVTVKVWVKKNHATNIGAQLIVYGGRIPGVANDVTDVKANDTNWEELSITFTPTVQGAVDVIVEGWVINSPYTNSIFVDDVTVEQA